MDSLARLDSIPLALVGDSVLVPWGELGFEPLRVSFELQEFDESTQTLNLAGIVSDIGGDPLPNTILIVGRLKTSERNWHIQRRFRVRSDEQGRFKLQSPIEKEDFLVIGAFSYFSAIYEVGRLRRSK